MRRSVVRKVRHWVANRGLLGFVSEVLRQGGRRLAPRQVQTVDAVDELVKPPEVYPFDEQYGVDTGGLVWAEEMGTGEKGEYWATAYYGIAPSLLRQVLERLALDWREYTFVDVGCGKGRALLLALRYPWRRVLGIELSPALAQVANENLRVFDAPWRQRQVPAEAVAGDATRIELPAGPLVLYLYHPFAAPVMRQFLDGVRRSIEREPREVYLVYLNPELDKQLVKLPFVERLWRECFPLLEGDATADRFGAKEEYASAYRLRLS